MADDARTHGTTGQNVELVAAAGLDASIDAPIWIFNKVTGSSVPSPSHLAADVYADQTNGEFVDAAGDPLSPEEIAAASSSAEDQGAIIDAGVQSAKDIADHPLDVIPTWAKVLGIGIGVVVTIVGAAYVWNAFKPARAAA